MKALKKPYLIIPYIFAKIKPALRYTSFRIKTITGFIPFLISYGRNKPEPMPYSEAYDYLTSMWSDKGSICGCAINPTINKSLDLTVIIPAYNAEKYISECLDSVISQETEYVFEVIVVDDGSSDGTPLILKNYAEKGKIKLLTQVNQGQSAARNNALDIASGRYVMFVDADDFLFSGAIELLIHTADTSNSDITEGNIISFYDGSFPDQADLKRSIGRTGTFEYKQNPSFVLSSYGYSPGKVYRRELWNSIRFPQNYIFEDIINKFILRRSAEKCVYVGEPVYAYRHHSESSSHGNDRLKKMDALWVLDKVLDMCDELSLPRDVILYFLVLNHVGILFNSVIPKDKTIRRAVVSVGNNYLQRVSDCRPKKMPFMLKTLEKAVLTQNPENTKLTADFITENRLCAKYREIN